MSSEVEYKTTAADYTRIGKRVQTRTQSSPWGRVIVLVIGLCIAGVGVMGIESVSDWPDQLGGFLALLVGVIVCIFSVRPTAGLSAVSRALLPGINRWAPATGVRRRIVIDHEGLISFSATGQRLHNWSSIMNIDDEPIGVIFYSEGDLPVENAPARAFPSPMQRRRFYKEAVSLWSSHRADPPAHPYFACDLDIAYEISQTVQNTAFAALQTKRYQAIKEKGLGFPLGAKIAGWSFLALLAVALLAHSFYHHNWTLAGEILIPITVAKIASLFKRSGSATLEQEEALSRLRSGMSEGSRGRLYRALTSPTVLGKHELVVGPSGFRAYDDTGYRTVDWPVVTELVVTDDLIVFLHELVSLCVVPASAFAGVGEREDFVRIVRGRTAVKALDVR